MNRCTPLSLALLHLLALPVLTALPARASDEPESPPADLLGGPAVSEPDDGAPSIVERTFDGTLIRVEGTPEEAALLALGLSDAEREAVDDVLAERVAAVDAVLESNLDLFFSFMNMQRGQQAQRSTEERRARFDQLRRLRSVLAPLLEAGTLRELLADALPDEDRPAFLSMIEAYEEALADEEQAVGSGDDGAMQQRRLRGGRVDQSEEAARFRAVLAEFRGSYERVIGQRVQQYQQTLDQLDIDPETRAVIEAKVQGALSELGTEGYDEEAANRARFRAIMAELTPDQQRELIEALREVRGE